MPGTCHRLRVSNVQLIDHVRDVRQGYLPPLYSGMNPAGVSGREFFLIFRKTAAMDTSKIAE